MSEIYKKIGYVYKNADSYEELLYQAPNSISTIVSNITISNASSSAATAKIIFYNNASIFDNSSLSSDVPQTISSVISTDGSSVVVPSANGTVWSRIYPAGREAIASWSSLAYGNGRYVAAGYNGDTNAAYSLNGIDWTASTSPQNMWGEFITYGNGIFFGYGFDDYAYKTIDGITWINTLVPNTSLYFGKWAYGNGKFVGIAWGDPYVWTTTDGVNINSYDLSTSGSFNGVAYGNSKFVSIERNSNRVGTSTDGITWTFQNVLPASYDWTPVAFVNGKFITAAVYSGSIYVTHSIDGITWSATTSTLAAANTSRVVEIHYSYGKYRLHTNYFGYYSSDDLVSWSYTAYSGGGYFYLTQAADNSSLAPFSSSNDKEMYKEVSISANDTVVLEPGIILNNGGAIVIQTDDSDIYFSAYGLEVS